MGGRRTLTHSFQGPTQGERLDGCPRRPLWYRLRARPVSESGRLRQGASGHPGGDGRRRGLMLTILGAAQCQRMEQISNRKQGETQNRTPEIDVMTEAMR